MTDTPHHAVKPQSNNNPTTTVSLNLLRSATAISDTLHNRLNTTERNSTESTRLLQQLVRRARQLDSLTSPASDASSMLSRANANLASTLVLLKEAREKFDTVADCEPAIERLEKGVQEWQDRNNSKNSRKSSLKHRVVLSEQDVYAAGDSIELLRDSYSYFLERNTWRSAPNTLTGLERLHKVGTDAMSMLIQWHLSNAGPAVRPKRNIVANVAEERGPEVRI